MVRERRGAPGGSHAEHRLQDPERPSSGLQVILDSALVESFIPRIACVQLPHGAHAAVHGASGRGGAQRHRRARLRETDGSVRDLLGQRRGALSAQHRRATCATASSRASRQSACAFNAPALGARVAAGVPGGALPPSAGSHRPGARCPSWTSLRSPTKLVHAEAAAPDRSG